MPRMRDEAVDQTLAFLHANLRGHIRFDGERVPIKVIVAPDGRIVAPVMEAMLRSVEVVLELPDDGDDGLQLMVTLERLDPEGEHAGLCDRWRAYHGDPDDVRWALMQVDASRFREWFVDGEALTEANPLAKDEPALLRALNAQPRSFLKAFCTTCKVDCGALHARQRLNRVRTGLECPHLEEIHHGRRKPPQERAEVRRQPEPRHDR